MRITFLASALNSTVSAFGKITESRAHVIFAGGDGGFSTMAVANEAPFDSPGKCTCMWTIWTTMLQLVSIKSVLKHECV